MCYQLKVGLMRKIIAKKQRQKPFDFEASEAYQLPSDADTNINNSYYFSAHDAQQSFYCRLGLRNGFSEVWFVYATKEHVYSLKPLIFQEQCPLKIERNHQTWQITFTGILTDGNNEIAAKFSGTFSADQPAVDFFSHMPAVRTAKAMALEKWNRKFFAEIQKNNQVHYEQTGTLTGSLQLGEQQVTFTLPCVRDHSFGTRDWNYMNNHLWLMAIDHQQQLNFSMVSYPAMTLLEVGNYQTANAPQAYILRADYDRQCLAQGQIPQALQINLTLDNHQKLTVHVQPTSKITYDFQHGQYHLHECLADFEINGKKCRGILEIGFNDDSNRYFNKRPIKDLRA